MNVQRREPGRPFLHQEAVDLAVVLLRPHDGDVGDRPVRDPELRAIQDVLVALLRGARLHAAGIGAVVRLGETEAPDLGARGELWQPLLLLRLGAVRVDRVHHEATLHGRGGAQPGIAALQLLHDEAVGHVVESGAAVALQRRAEDAHLAELRNEMRRERPLPMRVGDERQELALDPVAHGVADHALVFGEEPIDAVIVDAAELFHD